MPRRPRSCAACSSRSRIESGWRFWRARRRRPPRSASPTRLVAIADGLLVFDGSPTDFSGQRVAWRFGTA
jgi:hypothetical protein